MGKGFLMEVIIKMESVDETKRVSVINTESNETGNQSVAIRTSGDSLQL